MINCVHPSHFNHILHQGATWQQRIRAVRANASSKSHAELDAAEELDRGNPAELGLLYGKLQELLPNLSIYGGCCGTDHHHVQEICQEIFTVH